MQAFKIYFKILFSKTLGTLILYTCIFMAVATLMVSLSEPTETQMFETSKTYVAIIDNDNSALSKNFSDYVFSKTKKVDIGSDEETIKDAVFHIVVNYVIVIPNGFEESFDSENPLSLETYQYPNSTSGTFVDMLCNSYLSSALLYKSALGEIDFEALENALSSSALVEISSGEADNDSAGGSTSSAVGSTIFNYLAYPLLALILFVIPTSFIVLNKKEIRRRLYCSPHNQSRFSVNLIICSVITTFVIFLLFILLAVILAPDTVFSIKGLFLIINIFIFVMVCMAVGFFIANVCSSQIVITAIVNVVSLGACFTSGVFVPQSMLPEGVKNVAVINPAFWFVKANEKLSSLSVFNFESCKSSFYDMLVQLAFVLAFLSLALVAAKQKRQAD